VGQIPIKFNKVVRVPSIKLYFYIVILIYLSRLPFYFVSLCEHVKDMKRNNELLQIILYNYLLLFL